ncbi:hypothetical protein LOTGIDRAFT_155605 [Lottia gigantea]|uniref:Insulin-like domain-containing protein n=1 Tax=Lottia gigantea TaxID=225164 RepID=V3ZP45_LOTGI|nr:hypothetical protein LOTGIDRAFT_155605 [Lottia gigantea]ESO84270.1 hypothetical protein LOTGIDRAFT_155605 [Lottia gigantea]
MERNGIFTFKLQQINVILSTLLIIILTLTKLVQTSGNDLLVQAFADRFTQASPEDLLALWHTDCHRRCRSQLIEHVNIACIFDPYKIYRKKRSVDNQNDSNKTRNLFIDKSRATTFLATRDTGRKRKGHSIKKRGVMEECCYNKSCSWEEYAEYCHSHNRRPTSRTSMCYR